MLLPVCDCADPVEKGEMFRVLCVATRPYHGNGYTMVKEKERHMHVKRVTDPRIIIE